MILKAFKEKSNQKYVNKLLATSRATVNSNKVKTVAVLLNANEFHEFEVFRVYFKELGLNSPKHKIIAFTSDDKLEHNKWNTHYSPKDFGWKGKIENVELEEFVNTEFDALISYYKEDSLELNLVTALSKANFKIGISGKDDRLHDFIINVKPDEIELFKMELIKYLKVLNKIQ